MRGRFPVVLPLNAPTDREALADFAKLKEAVPRFRSIAWSSRSAGIDPVLPYAIPVERVGMESSNRFHYGARMACDSINSPSVIRSWYIPKFRKSLESSIYYAESPRTALALRKYIPAQFRPLAARAVFRLFSAQRVYDPCMGWGDRLSGALAEGIAEYHGRDVNPYVFAGYSEQVRTYSSRTAVTVEMIGAETGAPETDYFDLAFTSPPYFKIEKYEGDGQSHALFKTLDDWLNGFLFPMAEHALTAVRVGGWVAINISDAYCNHTVNRLCAPLIAKMQTLGATYCGAIGYEIGKRINSNNTGSQVRGFAEPILVFRKGDGPDLADLLPTTLNPMGI